MCSPGCPTRTTGVDLPPWGILAGLALRAAAAKCRASEYLIRLGGELWPVDARHLQFKDASEEMQCFGVVKFLVEALRERDLRWRCWPAPAGERIACSGQGTAGRVWGVFDVDGNLNRTSTENGCQFIDVDVGRGNSEGNGVRASSG